MDDNVKEAAERLRRDSYDGNLWEREAAKKRDREALADYALVRLADDQRREEERALPVTEDFENEVWPDSEVCTECHDEWGTVITWLDSYGSLNIPMPKTRGQLLDLLSALNIQPKEPGK